MNGMMNLLRPPPLPLRWSEAILYILWFFFLLCNWPFKNITATCSKIDIKYRLWINRFKMGQNSPKMIGSECSEICVLICMTLELITKVSSNSACFWDELRSPIKKKQVWLNDYWINELRACRKHFTPLPASQNKPEQNV